MFYHLRDYVSKPWERVTMEDVKVAQINRLPKCSSEQEQLVIAEEIEDPRHVWLGLSIPWLKKNEMKSYSLLMVIQQLNVRLNMYRLRVFSTKNEDGDKIPMISEEEHYQLWGDWTGNSHVMHI